MAMAASWKDAIFITMEAAITFDVSTDPVRQPEEVKTLSAEADDFSVQVATGQCLSPSH